MYIHMVQIYIAHDFRFTYLLSHESVLFSFSNINTQNIDVTHHLD